MDRKNDSGEFPLVILAAQVIIDFEVVIYDVKNDEHTPNNGDLVIETIYTLNWPFIDVKTMKIHQKNGDCLAAQHEHFN